MIFARDCWASKAKAKIAAMAAVPANSPARPPASPRNHIQKTTHRTAYATKAMEWGMKVAGLKRGVVIVMNPQNGEILALVSLPTYDDNAFSQGISNADYQALLNDPGRPLVNHGISDQYPAGSTYKLVAGTGVLADGKITATTKVRTAGYLTLGGIKFRDWNDRGFGMCDIMCGFAHSSDTFFYQAAAMLGIDRHAYWGHQYGFGSQTGIDLPAEASGIVPSMGVSSVSSRFSSRNFSTVTCEVSQARCSS